MIIRAAVATVNATSLAPGQARFRPCTDAGLESVEKAWNKVS